MNELAASTVASPCVGVCELDLETDWCKGCWRSRDEVAVWASADDSLKHEILARARRRRDDDKLNLTE
jgi:uncharacterized protein